MAELDRFLRGQLESFEPEIRAMADYCIDTSGKRIRPALVFLSGWRGPAVITPDLVRVAAVVELVHLATLVHDDIMDEADVLLGENFQPTIRDILGQLNGDTQIGLYTATISSEMEQIIPKIMRKNYVDIRVKKEQLTLEGITQYFVTVPDNDHAKAETLVDIFSRITIGQIIIYCNLQRTAEFLTRKLKMGLHTIPCECMHGKMDTFARKDIMSRFREGDVRVLVTTDMLARGIDVQQLSLVINYDFPTNKENYIHRIGRSGRYGRKGKALNLVTFRDVKIVRETEEYYDTQFLELPGDTIRNALGV
jgi:superfamily II DNA/RNA helicase